MPVHTYENHALLSLAAADWLSERAQAALRERGRCLLCLCGGSTPPQTYTHLSQAQLPWEKVHIFYGDERWQGEEGNHHEFASSLFRGANLHPFSLGERHPEASAAAYERLLRDFFAGELPRFDVAVQGLGADGHTASLFPATPGLEDEVSWAIAHHVPCKGRWRLSLTYPVLENSRRLLFLVAGADKRAALSAVLQGADLPATRLVQQSHAHIFCDRAAAGE